MGIIGEIFYLFLAPSPVIHLTSFLFFHAPFPGPCSGGVYNIRRLVFFNRLTQLARATGANVTLHK
jgi:hypothetical protein